MRAKVRSDVETLFKGTVVLMCLADHLVLNPTLRVSPASSCASSETVQMVIAENLIKLAARISLAKS